MAEKLETAPYAESATFAEPVEDNSHENWSAHKEAEFQKIMRENEVQPYFSSRIRSVLSGSKKVLVIDNSSSMNFGLDETPLVKQGGGVVRRIDELAHFVRLALPILALDSVDGVDVWFLNHFDGRAGPVLIENVHAFDQIALHLKKGCGCTPLVETLSAVLARYQPLLSEEGVHIIVSTDGAPDQGIVQGGQMIFNILFQRPSPKKSVVNFFVCTDDDTEVAYLETVDKKCPNVDVVDDYRTEKAQVLAKKRVKNFSMGDYVVKAIIGGARADIDQLDESTTPKNRDVPINRVVPEPPFVHQAKTNECCVIL